MRIRAYSSCRHPPPGLCLVPSTVEGEHGCRVACYIALRPRLGPLLMSMAEIADLARVKRPVVTTWRRRYPDFPAPAGGDAMSPLFDSRQVAEWLIGTGRDPECRIEADLSLHALAGLGAGLAPSDLVALLTALICLRDQDGEPVAAADGDLRDELLRRAARLDPRDMCLRSELTLLPAEPGRLAEAVDELVEAAWGCTQAFERVMGAGQRFKVGRLYARTVAPGLARLVAELSGVRERARERTVTVCDPAAGPGDLLAAVADVVGPDYQLVFQAADADRYLARLAGRRMAVHGVAWADLKLAAGVEVPEDWADPGRDRHPDPLPAGRNAFSGAGDRPPRRHRAGARARLHRGRARPRRCAGR